MPYGSSGEARSREGDDRPSSSVVSVPPAGRKGCSQGRLVPRMRLNIAPILAAAEAAYGADADHIARELLSDLLLCDAVSVADVHGVIERGLAAECPERRIARTETDDGDPGCHW